VFAESSKEVFNIINYVSCSSLRKNSVGQTIDVKKRSDKNTKTLKTVKNDKNKTTFVNVIKNVTSS